jgi:hypothetical protein
MWYMAPVLYMLGVSRYGTCGADATSIGSAFCCVWTAGNKRSLLDLFTVYSGVIMSKT